MTGAERDACWCGAERAVLEYDGAWRVGPARVRRVALARCGECGTTRTVGLEGVEHTSGDHAGGHYLSRAPTSWDLHNAEQVARLVPVGRVLDVGCNAGQLLRLLAERGLEVSGIDSNPEAAAMAAELGLPVRTGLFPGVGVPSSHFDAVVMSHVLEHLAEPVAALRAAARALRDGGYLFLFVPNRASWRARLSPSTWAPLMPVDHRWHFTPATLRRLLLQSTPLRVELCRTTPLDSPSSRRLMRPFHRAAHWFDRAEQVMLVARAQTGGAA